MPRHRTEITVCFEIGILKLFLIKDGPKRWLIMGNIGPHLVCYFSTIVCAFIEIKKNVS